MNPSAPKPSFFQGSSAMDIPASKRSTNEDGVNAYPVSSNSLKRSLAELILSSPEVASRSEITDNLSRIVHCGNFAIYPPDCSVWSPVHRENSEMFPEDDLDDEPVAQELKGHDMREITSLCRELSIFGNEFITPALTTLYIPGGWEVEQTRADVTDDRGTVWFKLKMDLSVAEEPVGRQQRATYSVTMLDYDKSSAVACLYCPPAKVSRGGLPTPQGNAVLLGGRGKILTQQKMVLVSDRRQGGSGGHHSGVPGGSKDNPVRGLLSRLLSGGGSSSSHTGFDIVGSLLPLPQDADRQGNAAELNVASLRVRSCLQKLVGDSGGTITYPALTFSSVAAHGCGDDGSVAVQVSCLPLPAVGEELASNRPPPPPQAWWWATSGAWGPATA